MGLDRQHEDCLTLQGPHLNTAHWDMSPEGFRRSVVGNVPFSVTETILYSGVPNTPRMFAFQKVKTTSNTQVVSGRQSRNNHSQMVPFSLSNKSHSCVLGGGFHWQLLDLPFLSSPNQKFCTVVADLWWWKRDTCSRADSRAPIHSPKTSLSEESHYGTADGQETYREREGRKTQEAKMHSSQKDAIILLHNNPKERVHHSLLIYAFTGESGAGLWGSKDVISHSFLCLEKEIEQHSLYDINVYASFYHLHNVV